MSPRSASPLPAILATLLIALSVVSGCSSFRPLRRPSEKVFQPDRQELAADVGAYKSVQRRAMQDGDLALAVAISGGGHRAGNFAASILAELEEFDWFGKVRNLLREVDYFSTVSGGGFAVAGYIRALHDHLEEQGGPGGFSFRESLTAPGPDGSTLKESLEREYHSSLLAGMFDLRSLGAGDRGDRLETTLDDRLLGAEGRDGRSLTLGDVFVPRGDPREPSLPYWLCNSTILSNGAIFAHSPDHYAKYGITEYTHRWEPVPVKNGSDYYSIPLSVGLKASTSVPFLIPATTLKSGLDPKNPYLHLMDGGIADNLGVATALRVLKTDPGKRKVLVIIDASTGTTEPFSSRAESPNWFQMADRMANIVQDSQRIRHKEIVTRRIKKDRMGRILRGATAEGVTVVFLSFDLLPDDLRAQARAVRTQLDVTKEEQEILFEAGRKVVEIQKDSLGQTLLGGPAW